MKKHYSECNLYTLMNYLGQSVKTIPNDITFHIFQKAQVTSNKMEPKKRHYFLAQFLIAFLVVWFFLFRLLAFGTIK